MPPVNSRTMRISIPSPESLSGQASLSCLNMTAGRRFAYTFMPPRKPRSAFSGRISGATLSHFGPPTAPSSTASDARQISSWSFGSGFCRLSIAAPPATTCLYTNSCPYFFATASSTRTASATTSGPIPSPGISAIVFFISTSLSAHTIGFY